MGYNEGVMISKMEEALRHGATEGEGKGEAGRKARVDELLMVLF